MNDNPPCPCTIADEPCHPRCTCIMGVSSSGCLCCCSYGSEEQKKAMANYLVKLVKHHIDIKTRSANITNSMLKNLKEAGEARQLKEDNASRNKE